MPKYTRGLVLPGGHPLLGTMFPQPTVENGSGERKRKRLDDVIGKGFCVLGINVDPAAAMTAADKAFWRGLDTTLLRVNRSRAGDHLRTSSPDTLVFDDVDGTLRDRADDNAPSTDVLVLRPDRYLAAACRHDEVSAMTQDFRKLVPAA